MTEYLLDLDEKWMVREVDICSFRGVSRKNDGLGVKGLRTFLPDPVNEINSGACDGITTG